ncbi:MAG: hypothetical protein JWQ71_4507 [Pedosphaera sp.]|nr:hypothetical protein [Pedosphaera sp.]
MQFYNFDTRNRTNNREPALTDATARIGAWQNCRQDQHGTNNPKQFTLEL